MKIMNLQQIKQQLNLQEKKNIVRLIELQEQGFAAFSNNQVVVPDVFHMLFDSPAPGDLHVKGAHMTGGEFYVIKLATGFGNNPMEFGIPTSQGLMILGDSKTGRPVALLQDEGFLTDLRTAVAGLIAAKYLAPKNISAIGVLGTGGQARLQVQYLKHVTTCRELFVWGRNSQRVDEYIKEMQDDGFQVHKAETPSELAKNCNLIITTTAATNFLLCADDIQAGTHITAMGTDAPGKQEIDPKLFAKAAVCVVDSKSQCIHHGDTHYPIAQGIIDESSLIELGSLIADPSLGRTSEKDITIADLTGVGVQDLQIATMAATTDR